MDLVQVHRTSRHQRMSKFSWRVPQQTTVRTEMRVLRTVV